MTALFDHRVGHWTYDLMIDIDDVIFPLVDSIHEEAHKAGLHDNSEPVRAWEAYLQYGCPPERYWALWIKFAADGGYLNTPPIPGRVEALRQLHLDGHRIHLVTARGFMANAENIRAWTPQWLEEFAVPHQTLTFIKDKVAAQAELSLEFDFAVDDAVHNLEALSSAGIVTFLMNHTHNETYRTPFRIPDLWEFARIVGSYEEEPLDER